MRFAICPTGCIAVFSLFTTASEGASSSCTQPGQRPLEGAAWTEGFGHLRQRLLEDGLTEPQIEPFDSERLCYVERAVELKMLSRLSRATGFASYADRRSLRQARDFIRQHADTLRVAEDESGVPPSVVAAILWIETLYGRYQPRYPAFNTAASLALLSVPAIGEREGARVRELARQRGLRGWDDLDWQARAAEIGRQWYEELKGLLELNHRLGWRAGRIHQVKGSWAAAIGYGQFLPTRALEHMGRGGDFRAADLWSWPDTIRLVARHLSVNGWDKDSDRESKKRTILAYNRLDAYAEAVLNLSRKLDESSEGDTQP